MFKKLYDRFHLRFTFNPFIRFKSDRMGNYTGANTVRREIPLIVSLTSYEERFDSLEIALYSLLNQTIKPDRLVLYLSDEFENTSNLPYSITKYIKNGLEIRFVKDLRSYTKSIYAMKEFSTGIIVTADDDIYYPKDWLEKLYISYISLPKDIHVHQAQRIKVDNDEILPYKTWNKSVDEESARFDNFITGSGGVLYPPACFSREVFREDIFLKYAPFSDDLWFWVMALISGRKIRVVRNHIRELRCINFSSIVGLKPKRSLYSINKKGEYDKQLKELLKFYGENVKNTLK